MRVENPPERVWTRQLEDVHHALLMGTPVEPTIAAGAAGGVRQAAVRARMEVSARGGREEDHMEQERLAGWAAYLAHVFARIPMVPTFSATYRR